MWGLLLNTGSMQSYRTITPEGGHDYRDTEIVMGLSNWYKIEICLVGKRELVLFLEGEQSQVTERRMDGRKLYNSFSFLSPTVFSGWALNWKYSVQGSQQFTTSAHTAQVNRNLLEGASEFWSGELMMGERWTSWGLYVVFISSQSSCTRHLYQRMAAPGWWEQPSHRLPKIRSKQGNSGRGLGWGVQIATLGFFPVTWRVGLGQSHCPKGIKNELPRKKD